MGIREIRRITQSRRTACRLAGALGLIFATPVVAEIASPSQGSIIVEGNRRVDAATVRSYFHATPDGHFDDAARDAALKALIATGLFEKVSIEGIGPEKLHRQMRRADERTEDPRKLAAQK